MQAVRPAFFLAVLGVEDLCRTPSTGARCSGLIAAISRWGLGWLTFGARNCEWQLFTGGFGFRLG